MALESKPEECMGSESGIQLIQNNPHANIQAINALITRTGYPLSQENGQRRYGPPPDWARRSVPDRSCEAFIGKIPRDCFEDELVPVLERIGPLFEFRLMMEYSGYNRGYGFVMYTCREHARKCVNELNNFEIRKGKMIGVCRSVDNCRLFVGGIPKNKKREEILEEMRKVTDDVLNVIVYPSAHDKTKNRGFAFVQYSSHRAAAIARRKLIPNRVQIFGQPIAVDWAEPEPEVDEDVMATVKIVYVRNLMLTTTEQTIKSEFEKATTEGAIERVKKVKDFAFVHFKEREEAINCINRLNGTSIDGSTIELSLSKPADKVNLQKLLRANPNHLLDYGFLLAQNVLQPPAIPGFAIIGEPTAQLAGCEMLTSDAQSVAIGSQSVDLSQKILNLSNRPYSAPTTKSFAKNKQLSRFFNMNKVNQNGLVIGNVKKQPSNQDVPYEFIQNYNQLPVLAYPGQVFPYIPRSYVNVLEDICNKEGLNQPVYTLHTTAGTDQDGKEIGLYMYKITLSNSTNPGPICSNRLMRTIEEAKNDAAEFVISQYFPQYIQSMADINDQYIHCQTTSVMPNAMIPTVPYIAAGEAQVSPAESNSQDIAQDQNSNISPASNESNNAIAQSQYFLSQPSHLPSLTTPQYVFDSNGQCILYPTQTFY